ncbi:hypothetical protein SAMN05720469_1368 [Fibrobacter intestinalis]|uniref:Uncharacterized protein n=1 Tax=Fibrobacter intestinalis TaxID=28122 RepID=A0A1M6XZU0_9BACT|nr:hypothetical protein BGX14_2436 [Fibrobacter sp. UWS1]SHL11335.1 hypothetical protein SAMN05720469_1368 [Fibrobacter intestinalis]
MESCLKKKSFVRRDKGNRIYRNLPGYCQTSLLPNASFHGSPHLPISSINGSGSNCSILKTPLPLHLPESIMAPPSITGTPVV